MQYHISIQCKIFLNNVISIIFVIFRIILSIFHIAKNSLATMLLISNFIIRRYPLIHVNLGFLKISLWDLLTIFVQVSLALKKYVNSVDGGYLFLISQVKLCKQYCSYLVSLLIFLSACSITIKKGDYFIIFAVFRILCIFVNKSSIKYSFYKDLLPSRGLTFHSIKDVFP